MTVDLGNVVDAADTGVCDLPRRAHLSAKAVQGAWVGGHPLGEKLQRNRLAQFEVVGTIHLAHPAATKQPDDAVARAEPCPRLETSVPEHRIVRTDRCLLTRLRRKRFLLAAPLRTMIGVCR